LLLVLLIIIQMGFHDLMFFIFPLSENLFQQRCQNFLCRKQEAGPIVCVCTSVGLYSTRPTNQSYPTDITHSIP